MEHKLPWEGRSIELFWDLDNIAFSHNCCNRPHTQSSGGYSLVHHIKPDGHIARQRTIKMCFEDDY